MATRAITTAQGVATGAVTTEKDKAVRDIAQYVTTEKANLKGDKGDPGQQGESHGGTFFKVKLVLQRYCRCQLLEANKTPC